MTEPALTVSLVDSSQISQLERIEPQIDFWEVRMDLIGPAWPEAVQHLRKPWIACNRSPREGGRGQPDEPARLSELLRALEFGAAVVDIELACEKLAETVARIKKQAACLVSYHNFEATPDYAFLEEIARREQAAGADICKIVTTARTVEDNLVLLRLIKAHPELRLVAFAMGEPGRISRVLSPLAGAYFTFASLQAGQESASGQIAAGLLREIYAVIN